MIIKAIVTTIIFLIFNTVTFGQDARAMKEILNQAETGDSKAQAFIGACYMNGSESLEQDYTKAVYWWTKAAEQGNAIAKEYLNKYAGIKDP